jgi:hypothetical protein
VGGDSDFLSLVEKLKQYDKKVFVVGGRAFTSTILQRNCHEFIAYENLSGGRRSTSKGGRPPVGAMTPVSQAVPIVRRALKILSDREVSPQTGLLKSTLLQLDSTFSERTYGASSFLDFVEKLAQAGVVTLKHAGRSVMVELNDRTEPPGQSIQAMHGTGAQPPGQGPASPHEPSAGLASAAHGVDGQPPVFGQGPPASEEPAGLATTSGAGPAIGPGPTPGSGPQAGHQGQQGQGLQADPALLSENTAAGVARASRILAAARNARWPMYLRNVKQILRQHRDDGTPGQVQVGGFDERRYGFGGLMDLLRALQREGFVRLERDRRGGLRVFAGANLGGVGGAHIQPREVIDVEIQPVEVIEVPEPGLEPPRTDQPETIPIPRDTTAELLGRAKPKRSRTRTGASAASGVRKAAAAAPKRSGTRRLTRAKKPADTADQNQN